MRLINLIGLFLLLLSFAVEGQNLAIRQPGKELCQHPRSVSYTHLTLPTIA